MSYLTKIKNSVPAAKSAFALMCVGTAMLFTASLNAQGQEMSAATQPNISVNGEGKVTAKPDMAQITLSVMRDGETVREAVDQSNQAMSEIINHFTNEGIEAKDMQTAQFSIQPLYESAGKLSSASNGEIRAYRVSNALTLTVRDLSLLGSLIDRSIDLGVNSNGNITFLNSDTKPFMEEARKLAVQDAMQKANTLAEAANLSRGPITMIFETGSSSPYPRAPMMMQARASMDSAVPVQEGELTYTVNVNMMFELSQN